MFSRCYGWLGRAICFYMIWGWGPKMVMTNSEIGVIAILAQASELAISFFGLRFTLFVLHPL